MQLLFVCAYFVVGTGQLVAAVAGVQYLIGTGTVLSFMIALFINYIPIVGSLLGYYGAHNAWGWSVLPSLGLCFWYVPVVVCAFAWDAIQEKLNA